MHLLIRQSVNHITKDISEWNVWKLSKFLDTDLRGDEPVGAEHELSRIHNSTRRGAAASQSIHFPSTNSTPKASADPKDNP